MRKKEAVAYFGTQVALARALGIGKSAVSEWASIPIDRQCQLEVVTLGKLKANRDLLNMGTKDHCQSPGVSRQKESSFDGEDLGAA